MLPYQPTTRVDGALRNLVYGKVSPPTRENWNWMIFKAPPQENQSRILRIARQFTSVSQTDHSWTKDFQF